MKAYANSDSIRSRAAPFWVVCGIFSFTVCLFAGLFYAYGRDRVKVSPQREYYFLVRDCEDTTASAVAGEVYLAGGAGYLMEEAGENAVALSCYFTRSDAERVQGMMREKGIETRLLALSGADFILKGERGKLSARVLGNIQTVEQCAKILYETANGLERAQLSQDEGRSAARGVAVSLKGLRLENEDGLFALWNARLKESERRAAEIAEGIVYCKDLRYLQVELLLSVVKADLLFS